MITATTVKNALAQHANPAKAKILAGFFKTKKGEYGEGDVFYGISVPTVRAIAKEYVSLSLTEVQKLLADPVHEVRLAALLILVEQYEKADSLQRKEIVSFYLKNARFVNNWDLVDLTADKLLGKFLFDNPDEIHLLYTLARSSLLWERRIAIVATFFFIKKNQFHDTLWLAELFLKDKEDLMHKAVGWMLREVGKRDKQTLTNFLDRHAATMPRTMLRYAIERFDEKTRKQYLSLERKTVKKSVIVNVAV